MTNRKRKRSDRTRTEARELCPVEVSQILGIKVIMVANAMRRAGITERLTKVEAVSWRDDPSTRPEWVVELLAQVAVDRLEAQVQRETAERLREEQEVAEEAEVIELLTHGRKNDIRPRHQLRIEVIAFNASKELARCTPPDDLSTVEHSALLYFGIDAYDHSTWNVHQGSCDGSGEDCSEGSTNAYVAYQMDLLERQQERARWSSENQQAIESGAFEVGQLVSTWNGSRIGVVTKHNRVTVRIRQVGGAKDGYEVVEKTVKPYFLTPIDDVQQFVIGETLSIKTPDGRVRDVEVVEVDHPFARVSYRLANKMVRERWVCPASRRPTAETT